MFLYIFFVSTKAEEQMQAYALSLEKKQSETIREAEVRAQVMPKKSKKVITLL